MLSHPFTYRRGNFSLFLCIISSALISCSGPVSEKSITYMDVQGHRGCRGLLPENTVPAFIRALEIGVNTLEMDVVISKDQQVLLSHEPFLSHEICIGPKEEEITEENEREWNLYQMEYEEIKACDCGMKVHKRFPEQKKMKAYKPLLKEVIMAAEEKAKADGRELPFYNIETKSQPKGDTIYHPEPELFTDLLVGVIQETGIAERTIIQSFDIRTLQVAHEKYPEMVLALLIENEDSPQANLEKLGFVPEIYSPAFQLVNEDLMNFAKEKGMKVIPWTLNEKDDISRMIEMKVDGIISDYPNRVIEALGI
ncbi:MAG: glycerophosphodiester phosphodiesterase family protein [Bacteroidota bacterium]